MRKIIDIISAMNIEELLESYLTADRGFLSESEVKLYRLLILDEIENRVA